MIDDEIISLVENIGRDPRTSNVSRHSLLDGTKVWIKKPVGSKKKIWHRFQRAFSMMIPAHMLRVTVSAGGPEALAQEAERLRQFAASGIQVPKLYGIYQDHLITEDAGLPLSRILSNEIDPERRRRLLDTAALALAGVHAADLCHGRPHPKDMAIDENGIVSLLDLEEDPLSVMALPKAQARDVWLFMAAAARYADEKILIQIKSTLFNSMRSDTRDELFKFTRKLRSLRVIVEYLNFGGKDLRHAVKANKALESNH